MRGKLKIQNIQGNNWSSRQNVVLGEVVEKFLSMSEG